MASDDHGRLSPVFIGRWQPWHNGHHHVAVRMLEEYGELTIGVVDPDPLRPTEKYERFHPRVNPFSYWQRVRLIRAAIDGEQLDSETASRVTIVPVWGMATGFEREQIFLPPLERRVWVIADVREDSVDKVEILKRLDCRVRVVDETSYELSTVDATLIRGLIRADDNRWHQLVPAATVPILSEPGYRDAVVEASERQWPDYLDRVR